MSAGAAPDLLDICTTSPGSHHGDVPQAALFVGAGVDKIRLTGGEPTLRKDLVPLVQRLHALPGHPQIGITSNGIALKRSLPDLQAAGGLDMLENLLIGSRLVGIGALCIWAFQHMWSYLVKQGGIGEYPRPHPAAWLVQVLAPCFCCMPQGWGLSKT